MKLKVNIKKPHNKKKILSEEVNPANPVHKKKVQAATIAKLRRFATRNSDNEQDLYIAFKKSLSANNSPKEFFEEIDALTNKLYTKLAKLSNIYPGLKYVLKTIRNISQAATEDSETIEAASDATHDIYSGLDDIRSFEEENKRGEAEKFEQEREKDKKLEREKATRKAARAAYQGIDFSNLAKSLQINDLDKAKKLFLKDIKSGFTNLAAKKIDPVTFVNKNPDIIFDLRGIFHAINLLESFQQVAREFRNDMKGVYGLGTGDFESLTNQHVADDDYLLNNFKEEFKDLDVEKVISDGNQSFNNYIFAALFGASDTATGGAWAKEKERVKKAGDYASRLADKRTSMTEKYNRGIKMLESNMILDEVSDPEFEEAMRELQSDPLTQTFEEYQQQAAEELRQAAQDENIKNLSKVAALVIRAFASYKKLRKERRADFAKRFLEKARTDYNEAESQLKRMVYLIKEPLGDLLEKYIDGESGIKEKLINLRRRVKDAKNTNEIPPERATDYIQIINNALVQIAETRKQFVAQSIQTINKNPDGYLEFLEDVESFLKARSASIVEKTKEQFAQVKAGETPQSDEETPEETDPSALKNLSVGKVNVALNQLRQKGVSSKELASQIENIIQAISKGAGPQRRNFEERDVPVINKIKDELVKILSGDFSNLIKENKSYLKVHTKTYKIINILALGKF